MSVKISLNCIVKNESKIIKRMLYSLKTIIDYYVILDTGSTDNTIELINEFSEETGIRGEIYKSDFINFEIARNEALNKCMSSIEDFDYILLCDADMNLIIGPDFDKNKLKDNVYNILQVNSGLEYYNIRLVKKILKGIHYRCPSHEYLDTLHFIKTNMKRDLLFFDDKGDGGCKDDKFQRDIKIFENALNNNEDHPDKIRIYFYLGQSYHCLKDFNNAIKYYEKRASLMGWSEEIFICWYRMGNIYYEEMDYNLRDYDKAIRAYLKALSNNNNRMEPVYKLIKMTRECGDINLAAVFKRMIVFDKADDNCLFFEGNINRHLIKYEYNLIGNEKINLFENDLLNYPYYYNLLLNKYIENIKPNYNYLIDDDKNYIPDYSDLVDNEYRSFFNPSICAINDDMFISIRNTNYNLQIINNRLCYSIYKNNKLYNISDEHPLLNRTIIYKNNELYSIKYFRIPDYLSYCIQGVEDVRLINFNNKLFYLGNTLETETHKNVMVLIQDEPEKYYLLKYNSHLAQKNWSPFVYNDELYFIYSFHPLIILKFDPSDVNNVVKVYENIGNVKSNFKEIKGGSQGIAIKENVSDHGFFNFYTHITANLNGRTYLHVKIRLIIHKDFKNCFLTTQYDPFCIEKKGIEYIAGYCIYKDEKYISYGLDDKSCKVIKIKDS